MSIPDINISAPAGHDELAAVKKAEAEARAMAEMKSHFLATMSHEIRTPMQSVYGLLELIADEQINENVKEMVATARKSASGLLEILDGILDLAKVEAGKVELDHFEIPVRTLAYGVLECLDVRLMGKPVKLIPEVAQDVPFVIMGDPTRLRQVMINLVGNSCKFTEKGSVTLRIHRNVQHVRAPEGGFALRFEVEDTGIGMPPEATSRMFQPFQQADNSTTRKFGGTGLGLSISHKLIDLMGGTIGVDSVEGKGSTFWFEIPTQAADEQHKVDLPDLDGLAVLSVENHPQGAKEILSSLTSMGAKVESVPTYAEGLDLIKKRRYDVAVIDQGLPDGLGINLLKEAAKLRPFMGLILYTARDDFGMQYTAKVVGAKYLSKPASRLGLGETVMAAAKRAGGQEYAGPRRLLIAEDTPSVQDLLKRQLAKLGVEADFVSNGVEALRALNKNEHGLLFTDLHMPDMDGYGLAAAIRAEEEKNGVDPLKRFPVVVLTADVQMAQRQAYLIHGFDECLLKPVSLGQFRQLLIRWGVLRENDADLAPFKNDDIDLVSFKDSDTDSASSKSHDELAEVSSPACAMPALTDGAGTAPSKDSAAPAPSKDPAPAVDRGMVVKQMGALDASAIEMLGMFADMTRGLVVKLRAAFENKQRAEVKEIAHSLKGSARSACCMALGDAAAKIQEVCEKGQAPTPDMIAAVEAEFARAEMDIRSMKV